MVWKFWFCWQPQYGDTVRSLPKPSPIPMASATLPKKEEGEQEKEGKKEDHEDEVGFFIYYNDYYLAVIVIVLTWYKGKKKNQDSWLKSLFGSSYKVMCIVFASFRSISSRSYQCHVIKILLDPKQCILPQTGSIK